MINNRLVLVPRVTKMHFAKWEKVEFQKHFSCVGEACNPNSIKADDVLMVYSSRWIPRFEKVRCRAKFCMLFPGWNFDPFVRKDYKQTRIINSALQYTSIFVNEGPIWEVMRGKPKTHLVPYSVDNSKFQKRRRRLQFKCIIQVARDEPYKGRYISEAAMKMMPFEWRLYPPNTGDMNNMLPWSTLPEIYQNADGFLSPNMIGPRPYFRVDAKYNAATMEAGLSGCIIFWHDCMNLGNSFETVFPISLDPKEIAERIQDVVGSIDLDKHSTLTAQEFYEKCNAESAVRAKVEIMKRYL
jgi:hypothetical protein